MKTVVLMLLAAILGSPSYAQEAQRLVPMDIAYWMAMEMDTLIVGCPEWVDNLAKLRAGRVGVQDVKAAGCHRSDFTTVTTARMMADMLIARTANASWRLPWIDGGITVFRKFRLTLDDGAFQNGLISLYSVDEHTTLFIVTEEFPEE
jgi:hypothetical protein